MPSSSTSSTSASAKLSINRRRQDGNPVLKYIRNVPYEWADIKADFEAGKEMGILYLSLKWHKLHPGYIETRMNSDLSQYSGKVLLVLANVEQRHMVRELNLFCYRTGCTLLLCYSAEEAAEYIENLHISRNRNEQTALNAIQEKKKKRQGTTTTTGDSEKSTAKIQQVVDLLCAIRAVSSSDAQRLIGTFGSINAIANADIDKLSLCPGLGPIKAENIYNFFRTPFFKTS